MGLEGNWLCPLNWYHFLIKEVHKRPLIFPSCKRGEEGEEEAEEKRGVSVCECEYMHTLAKVHMCKQKTTLDVSLSFYFA